MSLPLGFSPFDDYDSPYATTNAAIRRQSRTPGITPTSTVVTPGTTTPSRRPSAAAQGSEVPVDVPAAEDFGSRKGNRTPQGPSGRPQRMGSPESSSSAYRTIAQPRPLGGPLAQFSAADQPMTTSSPPQSPQSVSSSQRRPPPPPPAGKTASPGRTGPNNAFMASPPRKPSGTAPPPPPPAAAAVPEPESPPMPSQVALATPAHQEAVTTRSDIGSAVSDGEVASEPEMSEMGELSPASRARQDIEEDGDEEDGDGIDNIRTAGNEGRRSHSNSRAGAGAAALGGAAAVAAANGRRSSSRPRAAHSAYNMPNSSPESEDYAPLNEKGNSRSRRSAGGFSAAGAAAGTKRERDIESSWTGAGAAGGAGSGGAFVRSWRAHKKRWIFGIVILAIIILAAAIGGGVSSSSKSGNDQNDTSSGGSSSKGNGGTSTSSAAGSGTTGVTADPALHNSFYGINYVPMMSESPACGVNITAVIHDITILSQLTTRIRLAGSACNETAMVLDAIQRTGANLIVYPTVQLTSATTVTSSDFVGQVNNLTYAFDTFGTSQIGGIQVGNEYVTNFGSLGQLTRFITSVKDTISDNAAWGTLTVGTAELAANWGQQLATASDFIFANTQAWYDELLVTDAAGWTYDTFINNVADYLTSTKFGYISEVGWPNAAATTAAATNGDAVASTANLQSMLDTYICAANTNGTGYFWFQLYDNPQESAASAEATQDGEFVAGGVNGYWGLFDDTKTLKQITLPNCAHN